MKAVEFKSKIIDQKIKIPKKVQSELSTIGEKNVRVMIFLDDSDVYADSELLNSNSLEESVSLTNEEIDSINKGLKDFEEGRTHSHETARKLYEKYL